MIELGMDSYIVIGVALVVVLIVVVWGWLAGRKEKEDEDEEVTDEEITEMIEKKEEAKKEGKKLKASDIVPPEKLETYNEPVNELPKSQRDNPIVNPKGLETY